VSTVAHPIDDAGCKKIYPDKFDQQVDKIEPRSSDKRQVNNAHNGHDKTAADGVKRIVVSPGKKPGQEEHTDI
jgi:hypothetical protein